MKVKKDEEEDEEGGEGKEVEGARSQVNGKQ